MYPVILHLPFLPEGFREVYSYGLMMVLGFAAAYLLTFWALKKSGQNTEHLPTLTLLAVEGGIAGARAIYVIHFWDQYAGQGWAKIFQVRDGGLEFYGGIILAMSAVLVYLAMCRLPVRLYLDILAMAVLLGLAFGRIGCFLNGCCYGKVSNLPWAVSFPYGSHTYWDHLDRGWLDKPPLKLRDGQGYSISALQLNDEQKALAAKQRSLPVHPSQLYSAAKALLIGGILVWYFGRRRHSGQVFLLALILYGISRFFLEMTREEPTVCGTGLTISQCLSIVAVLAGIALWSWFTRPAKAQAPPAPDMDQSQITQCIKS